MNEITNEVIPFHTVTVYDSNNNRILVLCRNLNGDIDIAAAELFTEQFEVSLCDDELDIVKHQFKDDLLKKLREVI